MTTVASQAGNQDSTYLVTKYPKRIKTAQV